MSRHAAASLVALIALAGAPSPSHAGEPTAGSLRIESVDLSDHPRVEVAFVAPASLADVTLTADDVTLLEGGRPREATISRQAPAAQHIVLALDVSGSMRGEPIEAARAAAIELVDRAPHGSHIGLVTFGDHADVLVAPTTDHRQVSARLAEVEAGGRTALYDGVAAAIELLDDPAAERRTIVILADGEDNHSSLELPAVQQQLAAAAITTYAVELRTAATDRFALEELVGVGGALTTVTNVEQLTDVYDELARDLNNRYLLSYRARASGITDVELRLGTSGTEQHAARHTVQLPAASLGLRVATSPVFAATGLLAFVVGLLVLAAAVVPARPRIRLLPPVDNADPAAPVSGGRGHGLVRSIESALGRCGRLDRLATRLDVAGISLRPGDVVVITTAASLAFAAFGTVVWNRLVALVLLLATPAVATKLLDVRISRRRAAFADQLDDTLQLLAGSLRAGHSLLQAIDAVATEAEAPTSTEFRRIVNATRVGQDLADALTTTVERTHSEDFAWVAQAVSIHREVGGDLAEVLDTVAYTIRERNQIRRQVKALSAEGKLSAVVLMALPVGVLSFLAVTNPGYVSAFTDGLVGWVMLLTAALLMLAGGLWLRKLVRIQF